MRAASPRSTLSARRRRVAPVLRGSARRHRERAAPRRRRDARNPGSRDKHEPRLPRVRPDALRRRAQARIRGGGARRRGRRARRRETEAAPSPPTAAACCTRRPTPICLGTTPGLVASFDVGQRFYLAQTHEEAGTAYEIVAPRFGPAPTASSQYGRPGSLQYARSRRRPSLPVAAAAARGWAGPPLLPRDGARPAANRRRATRLRGGLDGHTWHHNSYMADSPAAAWQGSLPARRGFSPGSAPRTESMLDLTQTGDETWRERRALGDTSTPSREATPNAPGRQASLLRFRLQPRRSQSAAETRTRLVLRMPGDMRRRSTSRELRASTNRPACDGARSLPPSTSSDSGAQAVGGRALFHRPTNEQPRGTSSSYPPAPPPAPAATPPRARPAPRRLAAHRRAAARPAPLR